ncbi:resistance protein [Seminavis robusta]|uniref:Resistance protein n=1 Tax=Seminavis robusta TaxID=568900 RepID=A0A9N8EFP5_9STRA|nr:resistance protein [Seminavis robusta]|eukprot:Sro868_g213330.1 resistance protein (1003) ;mRNA; r:28341-31349
MSWKNDDDSDAESSIASREIDQWVEPAHEYDNMGYLYYATMSYEKTVSAVITQASGETCDIQGTFDSCAVIGGDELRRLILSDKFKVSSPNDGTIPQKVWNQFSVFYNPNFDERPEVVLPRSIPKSYRYLKNDAGGIPVNLGAQEKPVFFLYEWTVTCHFVLDRKQERVRLGFTKKDTVQDLKEKLGLRKDIPVDELVLFFKGVILQQDDANLHEAVGIQNGYEISVIRRPDIATRPIQSIANPSSDHRSKEFDSCQSIADAEYRTITISQLLDVALQIVQRCKIEGWTSTNPDDKGKCLEPQDVTLYDLVEHFIKPTTQKMKCSYAEAISPHSQGITPAYFVSHFWGSSVFHFISVLLGHAHDRGLGYHTPLWICAYCINQHQVSSELGTDPKATPFYAAMRLSKGVVSVLDTECVCYSRVWCTFEIALALRDFVDSPSSQRYLYDAYTLKKGGLVVGLADGVVQSDKDSVRYKSDNDDSKWQNQQSKRQTLFPMAVALTAMKVEIQKATATKLEDKHMILNSISGHSQDQDPPSSHPAYETINGTLRGKFAMSCYRVALETKADVKPFRSTLLTSPLERVVGIFDNCDGFENEAPAFLRSLNAEAVKELILDCSGLKFEESEEFVVGLGRLFRLESFTLRATWLSWLGCAKALWGEIAGLKSLQNLDISLWMCKRITHLDGLPEAITKLRVLTTLQLNFAGCPLSEGIDSLADSLAKLESLKTLKLDFFRSECSSATITRFWENLGALRQLECLGVNMFHSKNFSSLDVVGKSVSKIRMLKSFQINCSDCSVHRCGRLWEDLGTLKCLEELEADLSSNSKYVEGAKDGEDPFQSPSGIEQLGDSIVKLKLLRRLRVNYRSCHLRQDHFQICWRNLGQCKALETLSVDVAYNRSILDMDGLAESILMLPELHSLHLYFTGCPLSVTSVHNFLTRLAAGLRDSKPKLSLSLRFFSCCHPRRPDDPQQYYDEISSMEELTAAVDSGQLEEGLEASRNHYSMSR